MNLSKYKPTEEQIKQWKICLLPWWTWFLVRWNMFMVNIMYGIGLYSPLWFINLLVSIGGFNHVIVEDDMGDKQIIVFLNVVWNIPGNGGITRDITSRSLWYFQFVDTCYDEYMRFAQQCLPWNDLHKSRFTNLNADIEMHYYTYTSLNNLKLVELTLYKDQTYHLSDYDNSEDSDDFKDSLEGVDKKIVTPMSEDDNDDFSSSYSVETQNIMFNQITFVST